jgi:hypothetical protein
MKTLPFDCFKRSAILALFICPSLNAQTPFVVTVEIGKSLSVQTNQVVSVVGYDYQNMVTITGTFADGNQVIMSPRVVSQSQQLLSTPATQLFTGLTNISVSYPNITGVFSGGQRHLK